MTEQIASVTHRTDKRAVDYLHRVARIPSVTPALALIMIIGGCTASEPTFVFPSAPIIIIDIDTLRADHLGCYGYTRPTSPHIDALAAESAVFEWAFSQAPNTPPSQASILTGLYPTTHGMVFDEDRIPDSVPTLAETLRDFGYTTAAFVDGGYMSKKFGMGQGFALYDNNFDTGLVTIGPKAIEWVENHVGLPFLLLIHTYDTHTPYSPPEGYRNLFLNSLDPPTPGFEPTSEEMEDVRKSVWTDHPRSLPANDLEYAKALYDSEIRYVDDWVGNFVDTLNQVGLDEQAIIVLISDHGEEFGEHGSVLHEKLYTTVTHIPLMIRLPRGAHPSVIDDVVESVDLMPTLLELVGASTPDTVQGESLIPLFTGTKRHKNMAFGEWPYFGVQRFVAGPSYRLQLTKETDSVELYDYRNDRTEQQDLATRFPDEAALLRNALEQWERTVEADAARYDRESVPLDEATREQLKALGYLN